MNPFVLTALLLAPLAALHAAETPISEKAHNPFSNDGCFGFQECVDARREPSGWRVGQAADGWQKASQLATPGDAPWTGFEPRGLKPLCETLVRPLPIVAAFTGTQAPAFDDAKTLAKLWQEEKLDPSPSLPKADSDGWMQVTPSVAGFVTLESRAHGFLDKAGWQKSGRPLPSLDCEEGRWMIRAGYGRAVSTFTSHSFLFLTQHNRETLRQTKPHIFAVLSDGRRDFDVTSYGEGNLCLSEPDTLTEFVKELRRMLDKDPNLPLVSVCPNDVWVDVRHYPFDEAASEFECSEPLLNDIWKMCKHGIRLGCQDVFVDCPTREKGQYTGDTYIGEP